MYSSEDLERFYFQYQSEALPRGESLQSFCLKHNVSYNVFNKWYKDTRKSIVEVQVDGQPPEPSASSSKDVSPQSPSSCSSVRLWLELRMSNGLHISQKNLSYQDLLRLIEKVEVLC